MDATGTECAYATTPLLFKEQAMIKPLAVSYFQTWLDGNTRY